MEYQDIQEFKRKKRFLKRYQNNLSCIVRLEEKRLLLDEKSKSVKSPNLSGMPRGGVPLTTADIVSDILDLDDRIARLKDKNKIVKEEILNEIDSLEDSRYCEVLEAFFIDGISLRDIGDNMGYTERHIHRLYKEAIVALISV